MAYINTPDIIHFHEEQPELQDFVVLVSFFSPKTDCRIYLRVREANVIKLLPVYDLICSDCQ